MQQFDRVRGRYLEDQTRVRDIENSGNKKATYPGLHIKALLFEIKALKRHPQVFFCQ